MCAVPLQGGLTADKSLARARYMPVIPMVLVNGAEGIGTGWSTFIPNYEPGGDSAPTCAPCWRGSP